MEYSRRLEEKYGVEDIPLLLRNIPYKLAVLAYSFAVLEGEPAPRERHYKLAYEWLDFTARDIELDKYAETQRALRQLTDEEYTQIAGVIGSKIEDEVKRTGGEVEDSSIYRFVEYVMKHGAAQRDEIAAYLEVEKETVSRKANMLKGLGLLKSSKNGYTFTPKGVRFFKRWITDVTHVTTSRGQTRVGAQDQKQRLSPQSSDMSDMSDRGPGTRGETRVEEHRKTRVPSESGDIGGRVRVVGTAFQAICELCGGEASLVVEHGSRRLCVCNRCLRDLQEGDG